MSVVVPVHDGAAFLTRSLRALRASTLPARDWELIVVDDGSGDGSASVADEWADLVLRLPGSRLGPAHARNRGAESATGDVLVFVDADVAVHRDTLERFLELLDRAPDLSAVSGSYDDLPPAPGLVSRFRNLLHHHTHQVGGGPATTFWSGCGAIRREVFMQSGMFAERRFREPQIEDVELGLRLHRAGRRLHLEPSIQCKHLKEWSFGGMLSTDLRQRAIPWTRLILERGLRPAELSLSVRVVERIAAPVAVGALAALAASPLAPTVLLPAAAGLTSGMLVLNHGFYRLLLRRHGPLFTAACVPLHLVYYATAMVGAVAGWAGHVLTRPGAPPRGVDRLPPPVSRAAAIVPRVMPDAHRRRTAATSH